MHADIETVYVLLVKAVENLLKTLSVYSSCPLALAVPISRQTTTALLLQYNIERLSTLNSYHDASL